MSLQLGKYQTRNSRLVELHSKQDREITLGDGSKKTLTFFKGTFFLADGRTPETDYEWVDTIIPGMLGEFVQPHTGRPAGQTTLKDLVTVVELKPEAPLVIELPPPVIPAAEPERAHWEPPADLKPPTVEEIVSRGYAPAVAQQIAAAEQRKFELGQFPYGKKETEEEKEPEPEKQPEPQPTA